ncbi:MAG: 50S ribosomal protein L3 [Defluviitaleaceae bacterium]|nr:50S ribosomal protein L3 [Defluviitaleaceae bacterium]
MKKALMAKKIGMTQVFTEDGKMVAVTVLEAGPCVVVQKKTMENDGYCALQLGFADVRTNQRGHQYINKPDAGHYKKAGVSAKKYLKEFKIEDGDYEVGAQIKADIFAAGERVDITGVSKGKGFSGAIKRHNQGRGPMTHGSKYHRGVGSLGAGTTPGRVRKGKKMPGQMGNVQVTVQNLEIVRADAERNLILVKGAVPGSNGTLLYIKDTVKTN